MIRLIADTLRRYDAAAESLITCRFHYMVDIDIAMLCRFAIFRHDTCATLISQAR